MTDIPKTEVLEGFLPTYDGCVVCGQDHPTGLRARFRLCSDGRVQTGFRPTKNQASYKVVVHGGIISCLLDEIMGWPVALQAERFAFTGEITTRFKKPMFVGQKYIATAYPAVRGEKVYWIGKADICDEAGEVYASGSGKYFPFPQEQSDQFAASLTHLPDDVPVFG